MAVFTVRLSRADRSMKSARRARICGRTPPASPAATMRTKTVSNSLGCFDKAAARVMPLDTSSRTLWTACLTTGFPVWSVRTWRHSTMGTPASIITPKFRVHVTMSSALTRGANAISRPSPTPFSRMLDGRGRILRRRSSASTAARSVASISPRSDRPCRFLPCHL